MLTGPCRHTPEGGVSGRAEAQGGGASDMSGKPDTQTRMGTSRLPAWHAPSDVVRGRGQGTCGGRLGALPRGRAVSSTSLAAEVRLSLAVIRVVCAHGRLGWVEGCLVGTQRGHTSRTRTATYPPATHSRRALPSRCWSVPFTVEKEKH